MTVPTTPLPPTGAVPLVATGSYTPPVQGQPGDVAVTAGVWDASLTTYNQTGGTLVPVTAACVPPVPAPTIDMVAVAATSATTVSVAPARTPYGKRARATAVVAQSVGTPAGQVVFRAGGRTLAVAVGQGGVASALLPVVPVGKRRLVSTEFQPADAAHVQASAAQTRLRVSRDRTSTKVPVPTVAPARRPAHTSRSERSTTPPSPAGSRSGCSAATTWCGSRPNGSTGAAPRSGSGG